MRAAHDASHVIGGARSLLAAGAAVLALSAAGATAAGTPAPGGCAAPRASNAYSAQVDRALRSGRDLWGNELLQAPGGPSYAAAHRRLAPLLFARTSGGRPLTDSGVYYLPFAQPLGPQGAGSVELHVADGSEILAERVGGPHVTIAVGTNGDERYGTCLRRLTAARLAGGWLPVLETRYRDASGVRYSQESFAARIGSSRLTSYVQVIVDARGHRAATVRLNSSSSPSLRFRVPAGTTRTIRATWSRAGAHVVDQAGYEQARDAVAAYWRARLAEGATFQVPEARVMNAERSLLTQNLALTWRYSIGNPYEEFSFPESVDSAQVMSGYGFTAVARSMLRVSLTRRPAPYPNWKMGEKLLASATHVRLSHDTGYLDAATPTLRGYVSALARQLPRTGPGLLARERYSSDIPDQVLGLHSQAIVWQGLASIASVWRRAGNDSAAALAASAAARLRSGLLAAVRDSERWLPDGSLFLGVRLGDREEAYPRVTASRDGSYWNLVAPYALASGLFRPGGREAGGALRYLSLHGTRLLGLVRAAAFALYRTPRFPVSGTDEVYGLNAARFLADNGEADQLVLRLYGELAAGMTENTFISGESATVAPLDGAHYRAMYLPPNSVSNDAFLETLRLMLVHEVRNSNAEPTGLELAAATPRGWLAPGRSISVRDAPTSFGPLSYTLSSAAGVVRASIVVPSESPPRRLSLVLRLPHGERLTTMTLDGAPFTRFNRSSGSIDLSGRKGMLELEARHS